MKREVSPIIVALGLLALLVTIQVVYWKRLGPARGMDLRGQARGGGREGGGERMGQAAAAPKGDPNVLVSTVAGAPEPGYRDGSVTKARFDGPADVAVAADGNIYVADSRNDAIRRITPDGRVETVAGGPGKGVFSAPAGVEMIPDGSLLVADTGNHRICRVSGSKVTVVAGAETTKDELGRPSGGYKDGPAGEAEFRYPVGLVEGLDGAIYVGDAGNHCVRRIANGAVNTLATSGGKMDTPTSVAVTGGRLYVTDAATGSVWSGPTAGPLRRGPKLVTSPASLAVVAGVTFVTDAQQHGLYALLPNRAALVAGEQGTAGSEDGGGDVARFSQPAGMCVGPEGAIYLADFGNNCVRKVMLPGSSR